MLSRRTSWSVGVASALIALGPLAGCASEESPPPDSSGGEASTSGPQVLDVSISGDDVDPIGKRVEVAIGQPLEINIEADRAGEFHVHSKPEQEIAYEKGTSTHELTFDKPGVFPIESHDLGKVLVTLEVR